MATVIVGRLHLEQLKQKPMPNRKQKMGVDVLFDGIASIAEGLQKVPEQKQEIKTSNTSKILDEGEFYEDKKRPATPHNVSIIDGRKTARIDRATILEGLNKHNIFSVSRILLPRQMDQEEEKENKEIMESVQEPISEPDKIEEKEDKFEVEILEPVKKGRKPRIKFAENLEEKDLEIQDLTKPTKVPPSKTIAKSVNLKQSELAGQTVSELLPKLQPMMSEKMVMRISPFYMNNRKLFIQKLGPMFAEYKRDLASGQNAPSCEKKAGSAEFKLLTHQKVVRDYLNLYTPYRGLLLYHGLGSGKTCTSIAIAEGMKSQKHVFVLTLASLKANFFDQIKVCGDPIYKTNQFWEFVSTDGKPDYIPMLSKALSLSVETIRRNKGAWMVNVKREPNFPDLDDSDKTAINSQIDEMIRAKYTDINYNGLNKAIMNNLTANHTRNPFDNSVVMIDEAHNFVSRIVNKIRSKNSISYKLYEYLMSASNARIVLLSGTPIINYPNEIGIMFNILRGYIKTWTFPVQLMERGEGGAGTSEKFEKPNRENILAWFDRAGLRTYDYVEFSGDQLMITRNPFGFINVLEGERRHPKPPQFDKEEKEVEKEIKKDLEKEVVPKTVQEVKPDAAEKIAEVKETKDEKLPRCPKGQHRDKKTKECVDNEEKGEKGKGKLVKGGTRKLHKLAKIIVKHDKKHNKTKKHKKLPDEDVHVENGLAVIPDPLNASTDEQTAEDRREQLNAMFAVQKGGSNEPVLQQVGGGAFEDYEGVELDETGNMTDADFVKTVIDILGKHGLKVAKPKVKLTNNKSLPDVSKEFLEMFVELGVKEMKNKQVFQRRILGLTSYFKSADASLLPDFIPSEHDDVYHIERVPMSEYQFGLYEKIRAEESKREKQNKKTQAKREKQGAAAGKEGAEELFKVASTYRIASRMCCNFAFPDPPGRPQKRAGEKGGDEDAVDEELDGAEEEEFGKPVKKRGKADEEGGENDGDEASDKMVGGGPKKSKAKVDKSKKEEEKEEEKEESEKLEEEEESKEDEEESEKEKEESEKEKEESEKEKEESKEDEEESEKEESNNGPEGRDLKGTVGSLDYASRIQQALDDLKRRSDEVFSPAGLQMYSPKFLKILQNITNPAHEGLHLIYSQFRTIEGVGIMKLVLEANGFAEFKIKRSQDGVWSIDIKEEDEAKPKFTLYTGTETDDEKRIILNIYNSKWDDVPEQITTKIKEWGHDNNHRGEVVQVLMITSSGAEGINLKNTRYVHIVEPYWHMVRLEQVIGRARRICSHQDLPKDMRTVQVFLYIAVLTERQSRDEKHIDLRMRDVSKLYRNPKAALDNRSILGRYVQTLDSNPGVITTDQQLFENALEKDLVNSQILLAVKETAMDCQLYASENKEENMVCYGYGRVSTNAFGSYPTLEQEMAEKDVTEVRQAKIRMVKIIDPTSKHEYALNPRTKEVFDYADYKRALETGEDLTRVGILEQGRSGKEEINFDR